MTYRDIAKAQLKVDEGVRVKPYRDSLGILSIGIGRNLEDRGLRPSEVEFMLDNDLDEAEATAKTLFPTFDSLSEARKAVLLNMALNMGLPRLSGFVKFRKAVEAGNFDAAAREMENSGWYSQVGKRAVRLANQMRIG